MTSVLRIGTWNCFGMGQGLDAVLHLRAPEDHRYADDEVTRGCSAHEVLCVQELLSRAAQRFFDALGPSQFVARVRDDNRIRLDGSVRGCGLGIAARLPLESTAIRSFPGERVGWDRFARKGILYARVRLDGGRVLDLVNVHLQAGYGRAAERVRLAQLAHLRAAIAELGSPERPLVVCGDFNICGLASVRESAGYTALTEALEGFVDLGADEDLPTLHPHPQGNGLAFAFEPEGCSQRIDYIFLRSAGRARCLSVARFLDRPIAAGWASDHYGLEARIEVA